MTKYKYERENLYRVVIVYRDPNGKPAFAKYRNIQCDKPASWERSKAFFKTTFPTATHVNIYGGISRKFIRQEKMQ